MYGFGDAFDVGDCNPCVARKFRVLRLSLVVFADVFNKSAKIEFRELAITASSVAHSSL